MENESLANLSTYRKSNRFISAKYKASLLENQIMAIALTRIEAEHRPDGAFSLEAKFYPYELKQLISDEAHISRDLKKISERLSGHVMMIDHGEGEFTTGAIIKTASYKNKIFTIKFNEDLATEVFNLADNGNFTTLGIAMMTNFKKASSFRIYEVLKQHAYKIKDNEVGYVVTYNLAEFRFIIGSANFEDEANRNRASNMGKNIDWDELYEKLDDSEKTYKAWGEFERSVLKVAQKELAEKSDIRFTYEGKKIGKAIKILEFTIYKNTPSVDYSEANKLVEDVKKRKNGQLVLPRDIPLYAPIYEEFVNHNGLTSDDIDILLKDAEYDLDRVRKAIEMADRQADISNYMGWIRRCIQKGYGEIPVMDGSHETAVIVQETIKSYKENTANGSVQARVWRSVKEKEDFKEFAEFLYVNGFETIDSFEVLYSDGDKVNMYTSYKTQKQVDFEKYDIV